MIEAKLVALLRELSRRAGRPASDDEARAALAQLSANEAEGLFGYAQGEPPAKPLGPMAWADVARGTPAQTAAARELTGYYAMQAERDALAQVLRAKENLGANVGAFSQAKSMAPFADRAAARKLALEALGADAVLEESDDDEDDDWDATQEAPAQAQRGRARTEPELAQVQLEHRKVEKKPLPPRDRRALDVAADEEHASRLLTLFAYHRDTPLVAKALGWSLAELDAEVDRLSLRRKAGKLLRGLDTELPAATARKSAKSAPVRRRSVKEKAESVARAESAKALAALALAEEKAQEKIDADGAPTRSKRIPGKSLKGAKGEAPRSAIAEKKHAEKNGRREAPEEKRERLPVRPSAEQGDELRAILREIGPRRNALAARLGAAGKPLSPAALLARFRAAGLEREFGQRERDLIRALVSRHRSALGPAAAELSVSRHELEQLIRERGLAREVEEQRERQRTSTRAARWPKARIALFLERRDWLSDLGLYDELEEDVRARTKVTWSELTGRASREERAQALADALGIKPAEAQALAARLSLT